MQTPNDPIDRPLWDLLEQVRRPEVSGHFADDVLRHIRLEGSQGTEWALGEWFRNSWKMLGGITMGMAVIAVAVSFQFSPARMNALAKNNESNVSIMLASVPVTDLPELTDLDTPVDDNELWLGTASY